MNISRRSFIKTVSAASSAPMIMPSHLWAASTETAPVRMGFIGMGTQNRGLLNGFLGNETTVVAVCDVDTTRRENAKDTVNKFYTEHPDRGTADCKAYNDFRELIARDDINAICIATPDHWHAIPTIAALNAGKDVYCEKPLTHNIHEAIEVMKAVDANKRILQTGSMQRSMKEFRVACELVRNGLIGKIDHVECSFNDPGVPCDLPEEPLEPGLDWNMWVGPAPMRPYNSVLSPRGVHHHFPNWRKYKEFGGGMVCDWGAHHLDIAQWGLGMDDSGPVQVEVPTDPKSMTGGVLTYANGIRVEHAIGYGVHFFGSDGEVKVNRGKFEFILNGEKVAGFDRNTNTTSLAAQLIKVEKTYLQDAKIKLYDSKNHLWDFLDCVKSRNKPITSEQVGGRSAICCHLLNQAYYNRAVIKWDPAKFNFVEGTGNPAWLTREYRAPWKV